MVRIKNQLDRLEQSAVSLFYFFLKAVISASCGFFASKCSLFAELSPFSVILLSISPKASLLPTFCFLGGAFGHLTNPFDLSTFKYITALTMIYVVYMVFHKTMHIVKGNTAILSALCCFTGGFLFLLVDQLSLFSFLLLLCESVLVCCSVYFISYAIQAFKRNCTLSARELIAVAITMLLILVALQNLSFFGMNLSRILSFCILFLALYCLKTSHTAVLGCCLGILLAAAGEGGEAIFSAIIVGTLAGCIFSNFSNPLSVTAFIVAYYAVLCFYGKFPFHYWLFGEPPLAMAVTRVIPRVRLQQFLSSYIAVKSHHNKPGFRNRKDFVSGCKEGCAAICTQSDACYNRKEMSKTLSELFSQPITQETVEEALPFCTKPHAMSELLKNRQEQSSTGDLSNLVQQLNQVTQDLLLKLQANTAPICFLEKEEQIIAQKLKNAGLNIREINFIEDEQKRKKCNIAFDYSRDLNLEKLLKDTVTPYFGGPFTIKITTEKHNHWAEIREKSAFLIYSAALCKNKQDEQFSGDSALGFSIDKDHYCLVLTDGMGSGKDAGIKSKNTIDILKRLLVGGASPQNALNIYRAIDRFGNEDYFTTIDLCIIDLNDGVAEFYKAGAYDSFVIQKDNLKTIRGGGLPFGLSDRDQIKHLSVRISDDCTLIMASDGINGIIDQLQEITTQTRSEDVRHIAHSILQKQTDTIGPSDDDITVIVSKFQKSR